MVDFIWKNIFSSDNKKSEVRKALKENILFKDLNSLQLNLLENIVNIRNYRPGELIFRQGEVGVGMYLIVSGSVNIYVEEFQANIQEVKSTLVTQLKDGEFFGELALVEEEGRRSASASAQNETVLIGFFKPDLREIIERNPSAGVKILWRLGEVLGVRLRQTTSRISALNKEGTDL